MHTPHHTPAPQRTVARASHLALHSLGVWLCLGLGGTGLGGTGLAQASSADERVVCTQAPRDQWMSEQAARKLFKADEYALVKFQISKGNCHEFYAIDRQGGVIESYVHPVTGVPVRTTRIPAQTATPTPTVSNPSGARP